MQRRNFRNQVSIVSLIVAGAFVAPAIFAPAVFAQPKPGAPATPSREDVTKATVAFTQGTKDFGAKRFALALAQFKVSYDTVPSPNSHLYIARCQNELGDYKEAFKTFQKVIVEADQRAVSEPKYAPTRDSAKTEIEDVANKIGVLTVNVPSPDPGTRIKVKGVPLPQEDWNKEIPLEPGSFDVTLEIPGQAPVVKKVDLQKGVKQSVTMEKPAAPAVVAPPPVEPPKTETHMGPLLPVGIAVAGVGVIGFVMFAVTGAQSKSTYSNLEKECGGAHACPDHTHDDEISKGRLQQTLANVGLGVGVVGVVAGGSLIVAAVATSKKTVADKPATGLVIRPEIGPGYAGVSGSF